MRHFVLAVVLLACALSAQAQGSVTGRRSCVRYVKEHTLYSKGGEVNVINLDLEWPESVDFANMRPLQTYLSRLLFNASQADLDSASGTFKSRFGTPVTTQFATIPDDSKFCYVSCALQEIGYLPGRFISFVASYSCSPEVGSSEKGDTINQLVTYDLIYDKVLRMKDILKTNSILNGDVPDSFMNDFVNNSSEGDMQDQLGANIQDAALVGDAVLLRGTFLTEDGYVPFASSVALSNMGNLLTRGVKKTLKAKLQTTAVITDGAKWEMDGEPVHDNVDSVARFRWGRDSLINYISSNISPDVETAIEASQGRVVMLFVVAKDGFAHDVRIISAANPALNREVARVISMCPRWIPATIGGKAANSLVSMTLAFRARQ